MSVSASDSDSPSPRLRVGAPTDDTTPRTTALLAHREPVRIAVYTEPRSVPRLVLVPVHEGVGDDVGAFIMQLATEAHGLARSLGGQIPLEIFDELVGNLVHASFTEVVITILGGGNTIRVSDRGPGIPDKQAAVRAGFTSADSTTKRYIRGVGAGLAFVAEWVKAMGGVLEIEDNVRGGTVVTVRVKPQVAKTALAPVATPTYNLSGRRLKTLLLAVELAPVGPSRIARELGVATSTAYRDLTYLERQGLVASDAGGHRTVTDAGLAYVNALV